MFIDLTMLQSPVFREIYRAALSIQWPKLCNENGGIPRSYRSFGSTHDLPC